VSGTPLRMDNGFAVMYIERLGVGCLTQNSSFTHTHNKWTLKYI